MTVKELIEQLQQEDPAKMVVLHHSEGGYDEAQTITPTRLKLNAYDDWYYGNHERDETGECPAILIE